MKKRLLSLLLTVCLVAALVTGLTGTANADDDKVVGYLTSYTLKAGDTITFTDVDGNVFTYQMVERETLLPASIEEMESGDWDLTLFTCTVGGKSRVTVRFELISEEPED